MKYRKTLSKNYELTERDIEHLLYIQPFMAKYKDEFLEDAAEKIETFQLSDRQKEAIKANMEKMGMWYDRVFDGMPDNAYFTFLHKLGYSLSKYSFDQEIIPTLISFCRLWMHEKIFVIMDDDIRRKGILLSMHKMLDINNEIIISAYYDKLVSSYNPVHTYRNSVVRVSEKFSFLMHTALVTVLMLLTLMAGWVFIEEAIHMFHEQSDHALITALGSLLIIWVLVELMHTEIQMIKGGKFKNSIFISVALIAFIRDLMIITLKHETTNMLQHGFILGSILVLGVIYWLIVKTENSN
ncbi:MAG: phosphate-starvation-inducible PsiE family protein [Deferribacterales bacterium]